MNNSKAISDMPDSPRRWTPLPAILGCLWVVFFVGIYELVGRQMTNSPFQSAWQSYAHQAVWLASFGYVIAASALTSWLITPRFLRYGHLFVATVGSTAILVIHELSTATMLSDEKAMAVAIATRNQFARVWFCAVLVFIVMRLISITMGFIIAGRDCKVPERRIGISHLLRLTALLALLFSSAQLLENLDNFTTLRDVAKSQAAYLWLIGVIVLLVYPLIEVSRRRKRRDADRAAMEPSTRVMARLVTLVATIAILLGSSHWFDTFSDNFMAWFQIDWSIPNPIRVRGQMWDILPKCATATLALAVPLTCSLWVGSSYRGNIVFICSLLIVPIWLMLKNISLLGTSYGYAYPVVVGVGVFVAIIPSLFAAWMLRRSGLPVRLT